MIVRDQPPELSPEEEADLVAFVDGRAVGTWSAARGEVKLEPFGRLPAGGRAALEADARDVEAFLQGPSTSARPS